MARIYSAVPYIILRKSNVYKLKCGEYCVFACTMKLDLFYSNHWHETVNFSDKYVLGVHATVESKCVVYSRPFNGRH